MNITNAQVKLDFEQILEKKNTVRVHEVVKSMKKEEEGFYAEKIESRLNIPPKTKQLPALFSERMLGPK